jgi:hypothetical protein
MHSNGPLRAEAAMSAFMVNPSLAFWALCFYICCVDAVATICPTSPTPFKLVVESNSAASRG